MFLGQTGVLRRLSEGLFLLSNAPVDIVFRLGRRLKMNLEFADERRQMFAFGREQLFQKDAELLAENLVAARLRGLSTK